MVRFARRQNIVASCTRFVNQKFANRDSGKFFDFAGEHSTQEETET